MKGLFIIIIIIITDRDSSVGIATRYGLDGPVRFSAPSTPDLGPTHPPILWLPDLFPGGKAAGPWPWPLPPNLARRLKEE